MYTEKADSYLKRIFPRIARNAVQELSETSKMRCSWKVSQKKKRGGAGSASPLLSSFLLCSVLFVFNLLSS
jgi:hypothetical protein